MQSSPRIEELRQKFHENPRRYFAPLANEYRKAGDPEQAIAICRAHLAQQPGHMSGHVVYGQALYDARRMDEANVVFHQALALDPENIIVLRHLGDIARQRGDVEEARSWYSRALDGDPHDAEVSAYLAELTEPLTMASKSEPEEASRDYATTEAEAEARANAQVGPEVETEPAGVEDEAERERASVSAEAEALSGAESEGLAAAGAEAQPAAPVRKTPSRSTPVSESAPIVTRTLAELYLQQGYIEPALEIYRQLAEREPADAELQARIGELSTEVVLGAPTPAEAAAPEAAASEPVRTQVSASDVTAGGAAEDARVTDIDAASSVRVDDASATEAEPFDELWDSADSWGDWPFTDTGDREETEAAVVAAGPKQENAEPAMPVSSASITVREFFATLGSIRPPSGERGEGSEERQQTGAASEAVERDDSGAEQEYPIADDAFVNLFAGVPVAAEDSRAAAALSGAVAHGAPFSTPLPGPPFQPSREALETRSSGEPAQESEEDIRRFRQWLDGLADS